jgi:hypothetical protein
MVSFVLRVPSNTRFIADCMLPFRVAQNLRYLTGFGFWGNISMDSSHSFSLSERCPVTRGKTYTTHPRSSAMAFRPSKMDVCYFSAIDFMSE